MKKKFSYSHNLVLIKYQQYFEVANVAKNKIVHIYQNLIRTRENNQPIKPKAKYLLNPIVQLISPLPSTIISFLFLLLMSSWVVYIENYLFGVVVLPSKRTNGAVLLVERFENYRSLSNLDYMYRNRDFERSRIGEIIIMVELHAVYISLRRLLQFKHCKKLTGGGIGMRKILMVLVYARCALNLFPHTHIPHSNFTRLNSYFSLSCDLECWKGVIIFIRECCRYLKTKVCISSSLLLLLWFFFVVR